MNFNVTTTVSGGIWFRAVTGCLLLGFAGGLSSASAEEPAGAEARIGFFEKSVRPLLSDKCYGCHSADTKPAGGLRVDDRNGLLTGGDSGPAVTPGDPEKSLLLTRIRHATGEKRMPRESDPLTVEQIAVLEQWIRDGAAWPQERLPDALHRQPPAYADLRARHWAWQPLSTPTIPEVRDASWPRGEVDRFILSTLENKALTPVPDADRQTLIRRVTFDLTGLPPSPADIDVFLSDTSPGAYERVVDRLLAAPAFAEQWARHWLDVARYGESTGPSRNIPYPFAWRYRDYVIDAVRRDVPVNQFITEQIAGDLLPAQTPVARDRLNTATGFLALGPRDVNQRFKNRYLMDNADEQIDVVTRSVLGLTVSCARCHDHKFDPIPMEDYYALAGIFTSTDDCTGLRSKMGGAGLDYYDPAKLIPLSGDVPPPQGEAVEKLKAEVAAAKKEWDAIRGTPEGLKKAADGNPTQRPFRLKYEKLRDELLALTDPAARGFVIHGARDAKRIADTELRIRGEAERTGPVVPRGFISVPVIADALPVPEGQSGRLQLAAWLTHPRNALTPRVYVNRVWSHLFGRGLVYTVDNFGVKGAPPTHPELLDYLAGRFVADGWSLRKLVRGLVLTRAYQLGSGVSPEHLRVDPGNLLLWRRAPRRLTAEEFRDAVLAASGLLAGPPESSAARDLKMIEIQDNGPESQKLHGYSGGALHRSLYLPLLRGVTPAALEPFDPAPQSLVTGKREETTVPAQALFLLNSPFVRQQALAFAGKAARAVPDKTPDAIRDLHLRALGRPPTAAETARALQFLADYQAADSPPRDVVKQPAASQVPDTEASLAANGSTASSPDSAPRQDPPAAAPVIPPADAATAAWQAYTQAVFASAEFRLIP